VASVTFDRVEALRRHIADAVTLTSDRSTLPDQEKDRILEQACGEACDLLDDWHDRQEAMAGRAAPDVPLRDIIADQQEFADFLSPLFADALERAADRSADSDSSTLAAAHGEAVAAIAAAAVTARRHPRMRAQDVFEIAVKRVGDLQGEVCKLADQLREARLDAERQGAGPADQAGQQAASARRSAWRRRAVKTLKTVGAFLLPLTVSLVFSAAPQQAAQNVSAWTHAAQVVIAHELAASAQPGVRIAPPQAGPHLR
jgi:hypothetical protein